MQSKDIKILKSIIKQYVTLDTDKTKAKAAIKSIEKILIQSDKICISTRCAVRSPLPAKGKSEPQAQKFKNLFLQ